MKHLAIRPIEAADTRWLRHVVLRPTQAPETLIYPGDDDSASGHYGAFDGEALVGIASVYPQPREGDDRPGQWRLRGMAVIDELRGSGIGERLLSATVDHARGGGGSLFWCTARTTASGFYVRHGMRIVGDEFELPRIGPHVLMEMPLS